MRRRRFQKTGKSHKKSAAFALWNIKTDDFKFALDLAKKGHVALVPGSVFGPGGEGFVRLSYAASQKKLEEAIKRIEKFILNN